jgi:hypothetical protein
MPFTDVGFFVKRRGLGAAGGVTPTPGREITVTPTITSNGERVVWTIDSNMVANVVLNYEIIGANVETFYEGALTGNVTLNSNGDATLERNLDPFYEYASTTNKPVQLKVLSPSNVLLATSSNVIVGAANAFAANGGNTFTFTGGVDNLKGEYTVHKFDTVGNANITVTNLGAYPSNINIDLLIVGGGGAGDNSFTYNEIILGSYNSWDRRAGSGGGGGGVIDDPIKANVLTTQTYTVSVGDGGNATPIINTANAKGANSSIFGFVALGGGGGYSETANSTIKNGGSGAGSNTRNVSPAPSPGTAVTYGTPGTGTSGQGSDGGFAVYYQNPGSPGRTSVSGGGGGGATVGGNAVAINGTFDQRGGLGADGVVSTITGTAITVGSGGGGGGNQGGNGGVNAGNGAAFGATPTGGDAIDGFGGGGGGAGHDSNGGNSYNLGGAGGSGAVYVRYLSKYRQLSIE